MKVQVQGDTPTTYFVGLKDAPLSPQTPNLNFWVCSRCLELLVTMGDWVDGTGWNQDYPEDWDVIYGEDGIGEFICQECQKGEGDAELAKSD